MDSLALEQPLYFKAAGTRLFGAYHPPAGGLEPRAALAFVHPLLEEKKSAHRILVETARALAAAGMAVLRFDLAGCGDSEGDLDTQSLSEWRANIREAMHWLSVRAPDAPLGLLGVRFGAALALDAACTLPECSLLALWEPVTNGADWLRERSRQKMAREMLAAGRAKTASERQTDNLFADYDGFRMPAELVREIEDVDLERPARLVFSGNTLIIQISPAARPAPALETLRTRLNSAGANAEWRGVRAPPFWNRLEPVPCPEAAAMTREWLIAMIAGKRRAAVPAPDAHITVRKTPRTVAERPLLAGLPGRRLWGVFHEPRAAVAVPAPAVLFLHGWGAYRIGPHRMFVHAARRFAQDGMPVLRFDFSGRGDSEGATVSASIDDMIVDAETMLAALREAAPDRPVALLGMCSGAKVAAAVAAKNSGTINKVVFWSPEPPGAAARSSGGIMAMRRRGDILRLYARKLRDPRVWRKIMRGAVHWRLVREALLGRRGPQTREQERDLAVYNDFGAYRGQCLLVYGTADPAATAARQEYRRLLAANDAAACSEHGITGADHNFYHAGWENETIEFTTGWLNSSLHKQQALGK